MAMRTLASRLRPRMAALRPPPSTINWFSTDGGDGEKTIGGTSIIALKNLPYAADSDSVEELLAEMKLPKPEQIDIQTTLSGKPKGWAFLAYEHSEAAEEAASKLTGYQWDGRQIKVQRRAPADPDAPRSGTQTASPKKAVERDPFDELRVELLANHDSGVADRQLQELLKMQYKMDDEDDLAKLQKSLHTGGAEAPVETEADGQSEGSRGEAQAGQGESVLATITEGGRNERKSDSQSTDDSFEADELPGKWSETIVKVDRVQKVTKGGVVMTYRTLVVVGNAQGAGGFGMGRGANPAEAVARGIRSAKKNLVVVDRFKNAGLVHTVEGRHNNCKVVLRAVPPGYGMKGSRTAKAVLTQMGISDCTAKAHGRRNPFSVVRAIFKALARHQSLAQIARLRGRRIVELEWRRGI